MMRRALAAAILRRAPAGFTLLEMLVALVVLGFIVAGLAQGTRFGLRAAARQEVQAESHGDLDAVDRLLRRLVGAMDPGTQRDPGRLEGTAGAMAFTTDLGAAASALSTSLAEVGLGVKGGQLVLQWRPVRHAIATAPAPAAEQKVVLEGLDHLELSYWGGAPGQPATWRNTWAEASRPLLVRIRLVFPAGSARHWPDIVAGPATAAASPAGGGRSP